VPALASGVLAGTGALAVILGVGRVQLVGNARLGHGLQLKSNNKLRGGEDGRRMEEERERTLCLEEEHNKDENYGNDRSSENAPLPQHNHPTTTRPGFPVSESPRSEGCDAQDPESTSQVARIPMS